MAETPLVGYSGDCVVRGLIDLPDGVRLTEFLNDVPRIFVAHATLFALDDGRAVDAGDIELEMDELLAVEAPPGPMNSAHKIRTKAARVQFEIGPYEILGHVHGPTTGDPVAAIPRRMPMIPLTDATIAMIFAGQRQLRDIEVLIFNRDLATVVEAVQYEPSKLDEMVVTKVDGRAKDYTAAIYGGPGDSML
jgi:hypothetical protein